LLEPFPLQDTIMENFLLSLILDEGSVILTALILIVAGGFIGSRIFTVEIALRRVAYLWFLAGCNILLTISQLGWLMSGAAADQGLISAFILLQLSFFVIFGAAVSQVERHQGDYGQSLARLCAPRQSLAPLQARRIHRQPIPRRSLRIRPLCRGSASGSGRPFRDGHLPGH
jgi:hypothetical protein